MTLIAADSEGNRCEWVGGAVDALMVEMVDEAPRGVLAGPRCCP